MPSDDLRSRTFEDAKNLSPGSQHYRAYVGPPGQYDFMGATQFRLLCTLGLRDDHSVLDFGCGSLRAGRLLISYLRPNRYFGLEPNRWLIDDAVAREIGNDMTLLKKPTFRYEDDFTADHFRTSSDYIVAQSIFSHTGRDLIEISLNSFHRTLKRDGLAIVTFIQPDQIRAIDDFSGQGWVYRAGPGNLHRTIGGISA